MKSDQGEAARFLDLACLTYGNEAGGGGEGGGGGGGGEGRKHEV